MGDATLKPLTFVFTDIEGSTRAWEERPDAMSRALARHDVLLRSVFESAGGTVFKTVGDAFCVAFADPLIAIEAAIGCQRALENESWGGLRIRARVAVHMGLAEEREGDYFGPTLNRVARLRDAAHGGQILVSSAAAAAVREHLPDGTRLRDLGERRLKDLLVPEHIHQLTAEGLEEAFPPIRTLDDISHNLPAQRSKLIGRRDELAGLVRLLQERGTRLITLTGSGGTGKTQLALQACAAALDEHPGGVVFVALAPLREWEHVELAIAGALGVRETGGQPLRQAVLGTIGDRRMLMLMDNFEHVLPAGPMVSNLLAECPGLRVVATSRERLRLHGEVEFPVPPLPLAGASGGELQESDLSPAARLLQERARAVLPDFRITRDNAPAVARICAALDGLPLALELVAPRLRVLSAQQLAERIEGSSGRLGLLRSGPRDAPARHQTLRDAIDWSYRMLTPEEQRELAALSVFAGGFTPESAEEITGSPRSLELIESLLEKNLLQSQAQVSARFFMLETVREFASEMLDRFEDAPAFRRRHADWFTRLAAQQSERVQGKHRPEAITFFSHERANLRVALRWVLDQRLRELAESLVLGLLRFWEATAQFSEARQWLELVLAQRGSARVLSALGWIDFHQGRHQDARRHLCEALSLSSPSDALGARAETLIRLQWAALNEGDYRAVEETVDESIARCLDAGDAAGAAIAKVQRAMVRAATGDHAAARDQFVQAIDVLAAVGAEEALGWALNAAGDAARAAGDLEMCERHYRRALEIGERLGSDRVRTAARINLGLAAATRRDFDEALRQTRRALRVQVAQGRRDTLPGALLILALKHITSGHVAEGARLLAAAEQMNARLGQRWEYGDRDLVALASNSISRLDPQERAAAEAAASAMDEERIRREVFE